MSVPKPLYVQSYTPPDPGPYPQNQPPTNKVRFTPVQVDAIMSGTYYTVLVCAPHITL